MKKQTVNAIIKKVHSVFAGEHLQTVKDADSCRTAFGRRNRLAYSVGNIYLSHGDYNSQLVVDHILKRHDWSLVLPFDVYHPYMNGDVHARAEVIYSIMDNIAVGRRLLKLRRNGKHDPQMQEAVRNSNRKLRASV